MKKEAAELLRLAKAMAKIDMTFLRSSKSEGNMNAVHYEVSRFVDTVRQNENLSTFVNREDDKDEMRLEVGISDHEVVDAIVKAIVALAQRVAAKNEIEMKD